MKLYLISEDSSIWAKSHDYGFKLNHKWELPLVNCDVCGSRWGNSSIAYPTADCSEFKNVNEFIKTKSVALEDFKRLREQVRPLLPPRAQIPPRTQMGPLVGTTFGQHGDFTWDHYPYVLIDPEALAKLFAAGIKTLVAVPTEIKARGKKTFDHLEIQAEPHLLLSERCIKRKHPNCPACDASGIEAFIEPNLIKRSSIPEGFDLFRMRVRTSYILVTERFVDAALSLGLTNIVFQPWEVVDE